MAATDAIAIVNVGDSDRVRLTNIVMFDSARNIVLILEPSLALLHLHMA